RKSSSSHVRSRYVPTSGALSRRPPRPNKEPRPGAPIQPLYLRHHPAPARLRGGRVDLAHPPAAEGVSEENAGLPQPALPPQVARHYRLPAFLVGAPHDDELAVLCNCERLGVFAAAEVGRHYPLVPEGTVERPFLVVPRQQEAAAAAASGVRSGEDEPTVLLQRQAVAVGG